MNLKGKKVAFMGDSISEGVGVGNWQNCYHQRIKAQAGLAWAHVDAISGSRIAHQFAPGDNPRADLTMCGRAYNLPKDADLVVVFGGVNDYGHGDAPFGTPEDKGYGTFCGAIDHLMRYLKNTYKRVVFMTPTRCYWKADGFEYRQPSTHPLKKDGALPLIHYVNAIVDCGKKHDIPVLNLYDTLTVDPLDADQSAQYIPDGLHFNDNGHALLADALLAFLDGLEE